jgi:asparaginyl-tRNA synthetase
MHQTISEKLKTTEYNSKIILKGWVRTNKKQSELNFIDIHDGSMHKGIQIVVKKDIDGFDVAQKLTSGCSISVVGTFVQSIAKGQDYEIIADSIELLGDVQEPATYPMPMKRHTLEHLREYAHLRPRTNLISSVTRVRNCVSKALHDFFYDQGFNWIATPLITSSDCEGAGEMFKVSTLDFDNIPKTESGEVDYSKDFFGKQSGLTVSGQLNAETYACALTKVYTFGPTFRAENSNTSRHLAEFWMVEPEMAFYNMKDTIELSEKMLKFVVSRVLEERKDDMDFFDSFVSKGIISQLETFISKDFAIIDYTDAIDVLIKSKREFENTPYWGIDLGSEHERYLAEVHFEAPVAIINYPKDIKSFYMRQNDDKKTVAAFDVIAPNIGEIIGGSQREERLDLLVERMKESGVDLEEYSWYVDLRKYGTVEHSGFGLGLERLVSYITGVSNVRDVIPFPRTPNSIKF